MELQYLGLNIDALYAMREKRLEVEKQVKQLKEEEYAMRNAILLALGESGLAKASGQLATASIRTSEIPVVSDWEEVYNFISEHDRFDLLQKRLSTIAWRDLKESGTLVPGTEAVEDTDISLTKSVRGI